MLATLSFSFTTQVNASTIIPQAEQQQIATVLEHNAEVISTTKLDEQITDQPPAVEAEILHINMVARGIVRSSGPCSCPFSPHSSGS